MPILKKFKVDDSGQSVTEFAIILPVFILLITGVLVLGSMIYAKSIVVLAASQGARVGGAIFDDSAYTESEKIEKVKNTALTVVSNGLSGEDREVTVTRAGDEVQVPVKYKYYIPVPLIMSLLGGDNTFEIDYTSSYLIL